MRAVCYYGVCWISCAILEFRIIHIRCKRCFWSCKVYTGLGKGVWKKLCCWRTYTQSTMIYYVEMRHSSAVLSTSIYLRLQLVLAPCLLCRLLCAINKTIWGKFAANSSSRKTLTAFIFAFPFSWSLPTKSRARIYQDSGL